MTRHLPAAALIAVLTTAFMCGIAAWAQSYAGETATKDVYHEQH